MTSITVDPSLVRQVGVTPAVVHAVLVANDTGNGTTMGHKQLAKAAGIGVATAQRAVYKLCKAGLLKSEAQYEHGGYRANLYRFPIAAQGDEGGHHLDEGGQNETSHHTDETSHQVDESITSTTSTTSTKSLNKEVVVDVIPTKQAPGGDALRASGASFAGARELGKGQEELQWVPAGTPMPGPVRMISSWPNYLDLYHHALWLVSHFESLVLARDNSQSLAAKPKASVGNHRRQAWLTSAHDLLNHHTLADVVPVIDWLFTSSSGYLPSGIEVVSKYTKRPSRKVTHIAQVFEYFTELKAEMETGPTAQPGQIAYGPAFTELKANMGLDQPAHRIDYGQPFTDTDQEAKVTQLVDLFTHFRRASEQQVEYKVWGWRKTFRLMLHRDKTSFEDIKLVVSNLRTYDEYIDINRYGDPYRLRQEFDHLHKTVAMLRQYDQKAPERPLVAAIAHEDDECDAYYYSDPETRELEELIDEVEAERPSTRRAPGRRTVSDTTIAERFARHIERNKP